MASEEMVIGGYIYDVQACGTTIEWTNNYDKAYRIFKASQIPAQIYQLIGAQKVLLEEHNGVPIHGNR